VFVGLFLGTALELLRGTVGFQPKEARGNNRSVIPLDVLGCTRNTMMDSLRRCFYSFNDEKISWVERLGESFQHPSCWG